MKKFATSRYVRTLPRRRNLGMRQRTLRIALANLAKLLAIVALLGSGFSLTGAGELIVSGQGGLEAQKATDVDYIFDSADARKLSAVEFKVFPAPGHDAEVKIRLEPEGIWHGCRSEGPKVVCPTLSTPITLEQVVELQVVAT